MNRPYPISPLSLQVFQRDYYGGFDALILAQLAPLCENECYQPKIYRAPALQDELLSALGYASYGLKITPGAIVYGLYLPPSSPTSNLPGAFNLQITDTSLKHTWWDQPVPSYMVANNRPSYLSASQDVIGSAPNLLDAPYPIVGSGLLSVEVWETSNATQRIEIVFGVLEPFGEACL
jgi:hypothetical protein